MLDFEVQRCTRKCAVTQRDLAPGETIYSALVAKGGNLLRFDIASEAWTEPPADCVGWWKWRLPAANAAKTQWAPDEVLLQTLEELHARPDQHDLAYFLGLMLTRRRLLRLEKTERDDAGLETLTLYAPSLEVEYRLVEPRATPGRVVEIQAELERLLRGG